MLDNFLDFMILMLQFFFASLYRKKIGWKRLQKLLRKVEIVFDLIFMEMGWNEFVWMSVWLKSS